jgi:hypothetical protein
MSTKDLWLVLRPSKISGVGVFTDKVIYPDKEVILWKGNCSREVKNPRGRLKVLADWFGVKKTRGRYVIPDSFLNPALVWYLNHSTKPNLKITQDDRFISIRKIRAGEELTIDYYELDDEVDNSL